MIIRCSSLPAWDDCSRRVGGQQFGAVLEGHGFALRELLPNVGGAIGTAVHAAAGHLLTSRLEGLPEPGMAECLKIAVDRFITSVAKGALWDATSPTPLVAVQQIERMVRVYLPLLVKTEPLIVETELRATVKEGGGWQWILSGHVDSFSVGGDLDDLKTGVPPRSYEAQLGGYLLDLRANGHEPKKASMTFVKRVRLSNPQPRPARTEYDLAQCERTARRAIQDICQSMEAFHETGNIYSLRANPMSLLCTEKYCPAWGTTFCTSHTKPQEAQC